MLRQVYENLFTGSREAPLPTIHTSTGSQWNWQNNGSVDFRGYTEILAEAKGGVKCGV